MLFQSLTACDPLLPSVPQGYPNLLEALCQREVLSAGAALDGILALGGGRDHRATGAFVQAPHAGLADGNIE